MTRLPKIREAGEEVPWRMGLQPDWEEGWPLLCSQGLKGMREEPRCPWEGHGAGGYKATGCCVGRILPSVKTRLTSGLELFGGH